VATGSVAASGERKRSVLCDGNMSGILLNREVDRAIGRYRLVKYGWHFAIRVSAKGVIFNFCGDRFPCLLSEAFLCFYEFDSSAFPASGKK
jgi:hypothetical protein